MTNSSTHSILTSAETLPGFIWAYRFDNHGVATPLLVISDVRELACPEGGFLWLHLAASDVRLPNFFNTLGGLPVQAQESLLTRDYHFTGAVTDDVIHAVLPDFDYNPEANNFEADNAGASHFKPEHLEDWTISRLHIAVTTKLVITTRLHALHSPYSVKTMLDNGAKVKSPYALFSLLLDGFHHKAESLTTKLYDAIDTIEDTVFDDKVKDERRALGPVRRQLVRLHRYMRSGANALTRASNNLEEASPLHDAIADVLSRASAQMQALDLDVSSLQDRARLLHEEIESKATAQTNRHLFILSIISALLLPPTLVTGYFGMNTKDLPLQATDNGAWFATLIIVFVTILSLYLLHKMEILKSGS